VPRTGLEPTPAALPAGVSSSKAAYSDSSDRFNVSALGDVMDRRPVPVSLEDVPRSCFHRLDAEPAEGLAETYPRRRLVVRHLSVERA
jgi:hypothetical protein